MFTLKVSCVLLPFGFIYQNLYAETILGMFDLYYSLNEFYRLFLKNILLLVTIICHSEVTKIECSCDKLIVMEAVGNFEYIMFLLLMLELTGLCF